MFSRFSDNEICILLVAIQCGILKIVYNTQPNTISGISRIIKIEERKVETILIALVAIGLLRRNNNGEYILRDSIEGSVFDVSNWKEIPSLAMRVCPHIFQEVNVLLEGITRDDTNGRKSFFQDMTDIESNIYHAAFYSTALTFASALPRLIDFSRFKHLLDIGCSSGAYSIAILQKYPHLKGTLYDLPIACEVASAQIEVNDLTDRTSIIEGDIFYDPLPNGADVILLSRVIHDWPDKQATMILDKCYKVLLKTRGTLLIHEEILSDDKDGPLGVALSSVALVANVPGAHPRTKREIDNLIKRTGLAHVNTYLPNNTFTLIEYSANKQSFARSRGVL